MSTQQQTQPLITHLIELRNRILKAIASVLVVFVCLVWFSSHIYEFVSAPLIDRLPEGASMIATDVASPFFTPLKLTLVASVFVAVPLVLYQIWAFVAPGLYKHERRLIAPLLFSSSLLFYAGVAFAYFVVFPLIFGFFTAISLGGVEFATDISSYLDFVLSLFMAFGIAFEVPVAIILLCWTGATDAKSLAQKRPYIVVVAFVVGMLLTPPDMVSQTLLAVPMCILFEIGLFFSRFYTKRGESDEDQDDNDEDEVKS
ncbi:MAG TPA: twin-arginine translocase subunit TatC [Vibrio sp.]|uniref:twin-arginine translocase subunit TatC n=1 Tax=Vibrio TaxID=662 RepID=UPI00041FEE87|nr:MULTISPECIES: twin-arginine translocase subunit TatC [Vibrio]HCH00602.1 twin-arginine translocase subunit TatC [Vibrio sp.]